MRVLSFFLVAILASLSLSGCASAPNPRALVSQRVFSGTLEVAERVQLSPSSNVRISLLEIAKPGEPPRILVTNQLTTRGRQFPLPFEIQIDENLIKSNGAYAIAASVAVAGQLRFVATPPTMIDATAGRSDLKIVLTAPQAMR